MRVVFGRGRLAEVSSEARALGSRPLVVSGRHEAAAAERVAGELGDSLAGWIRQVAQHVPVASAAQAIAAARDGGADVVISIGGGSATGLAKAVAREVGLPVLAVPTTYAGSEMTPVWGQSDEGGKTTGRDERVLPRTVVYDPALTVSMPGELTAASGMNALAHAVESLYALDSTELSRSVAEEAIRALTDGLPDAVSRPDDLGARTGTLRGAWLAGWALGATTMGLHHKLAHLLGGRYRLWHAGVHSALLPQVTAFNAPSVGASLRSAARALGVAGPGLVARALFDLARRLGAPTALAELGLDRGALDEVSTVVAAATISNPRPLTEEAVARVLRQAYVGERPNPTPSCEAPPTATLRERSL
ncbi:MAG: maleylacetate reductase [Actinomycetes bacterium]